MPDIFDRIRTSCAAVAAQSTHVTIDETQIAPFADRLDLELPPNDPGQRPLGQAESTAAFVMSLDAINFGSGYFPHLQKRPGMSGYHTIAASLRDFVADTGAITAARLGDLTLDDAAAIFDQILDGGPAHELMELFITALHDLAAFVDRTGDGTFLSVIEAADGSAAALVEMLDEMPFYRDVHQHPAGKVLLYKRAQITVQDLAVTFEHQGPGRFDDLHRVTMFADNLVPHVLRVNDVLQFSPALLSRIEAVEDIPIGSVEEVEIRACGLHAVELLTAEVRDRGEPITTAALDNILWNTGAQPIYKSILRHRSRCVFY
jgi:hypothetical protein